MKFTKTKFNLLHEQVDTVKFNSKISARNSKLEIIIKIPKSKSLDTLFFYSKILSSYNFINTNEKIDGLDLKTSSVSVQEKVDNIVIKSLAKKGVIVEPFYKTYIVTNIVFEDKIFEEYGNFQSFDSKFIELLNDYIKEEVDEIVHRILSLFEEIANNEEQIVRSKLVLSNKGKTIIEINFGIYRDLSTYNILTIDQEHLDKKESLSLEFKNLAKRPEISTRSPLKFLTETLITTREGKTVSFVKNVEAEVIKMIS